MADIQSKFISGLGKGQIDKLLAAEAEKRDKEQSPDQILKECGTLGISAAIVYNCANHGTQEVRFIDPYEFKNGMWYAHCHTHRETHSFVLSRIMRADKKPNIQRTGPYPYVGPKVDSPLTWEDLSGMPAKKLTGGTA